MGYLTNYDLKYDRMFAGDEQLLSELGEITGYVWDGDLSLQDVKWYNHNLHMKKLSDKYPKVLFTLSGVGEDFGDIWRKYYQGGKVQVVQGRIVYDKFDANKLGN